MPDNPHKGALTLPPYDPAFSRGQNHLLAIAIDAYTGGIRTLNNCKRDTEKLIEHLTRDYWFEEGRITRLYDQAATLAGIVDTLHDLLARLPEGDNLLVYFSGHGHYDKRIKEGYWVPADAQMSQLGTYFPYSTLQKLLASGKQIHHIFLLVDACYAGAVMVRSHAEKWQERLERDPSRWLIASGRNEVVLDGFKGAHSPFAKELFYLLDRYKGEGIHVLRLIDRLTENVSYNARQTPIGEPIQDVGHRGGQFVFWPRNPGPSSPGKEALQPVAQAPPDATRQPARKQSPDPTPPPIRATVRNYIRRARTERALEALDEWVLLYRPDLLPEVIALQGQLSMNKRDHILGILQGTARQQAESALTVRILTFSQDLP